MTREVRWLPRARRDLKRLDPPVRRRVVDAVNHFARTGEGDVVHLVNVKPPEYRLRIGDWRARFARDDEDPSFTSSECYHGVRHTVSGLR